MLTVFDVDGLPVRERTSAWAEAASNALVPQRFRFPAPQEFHARMTGMPLGVAELLHMTYGPLVTERTPKDIRRQDPEYYQLGCTILGEQGIEQARNQALLGAGEMVLYDSSVPFTARSGLSPGTSGSYVLQFPKRSMRLSPQRVRSLVAVPLQARTGVGRLLFQLLAGIEEQFESCSPRDLVQLGQTAIDLTAVLLGRHADRAPVLPPESRQHVLFLRMVAFIDRNLADPGLSPCAVASAHGVSLRYLHRVFQIEGTTPTRFIREQRLARCRRDLANPALGNVPVHAIGARWGFPRASDFDRAFRAAAGVPPGRYRALATHHAAAPRSPEPYARTTRWPASARPDDE
ncbi:helix-turn-helix domain-containing protein [Streptomyces sp. NPDC057375]|uniref:AraC-like ligand-binding domain-containing protein n=1 Tax=Streptomyces sp. NPDC057375 TaxID=3346109 RepID=UPI00363A7915